MRKSTWLVGLTGLAVVGALAVGTPMQAGAVSATRSEGVVGAQQQMIRLITGDVVVLRTQGGRQTAQVIKAQQTGPGSAFQTFNRGGDLYVVPESATPYLGSTLSASLFDVTHLAQHPGRSLAVTIHLRGGATAAAVPGFTVQSMAGSTEHGYFTASSARTFGRALAAQAMRDHASPTHTTGLFRTVDRIVAVDGSAAADGSARVSVRPAAGSGTLTIKGTDWAGNPDNGDSVAVYNVDDINAYNNFVTFTAGQVQMPGVPNGNYSAIAYFFDSVNGVIYAVTLAQFKVKGDTTVSMDARDASAPLTVTTPKASSPVMTSMTIGRADANGVVGSDGFLAGNQAFYVAPVKKAPKVGQLYYDAQLRNFSTGSKKSYEYDLKFHSEGTISADQTYSPKAGAFATVNATYGADHSAQTSLDGRFAALPWELFLITSDTEFTVPLQRTEYYLADPSVAWERFDYQIEIPSPFTLAAWIQTGWEYPTAGAKSSEPWGVDPVHPGLAETPIYVGTTICPACLEGTTLDALSFPYDDNVSNHITYNDVGVAGLTETQAWQILADKKVAQQGTGVLQASASVAGAKKYTISYDTTRTSDDFTLSTDTSTTWTFPANGDTVALPDGWECSGSGGSDCSVLPLIRASYDLPTDSTGQIKSGSETAKITLSHVAGGKIGAKLTAKVSFDGGDSYTKAKVKGGKNGVFKVKFTVPKKGKTDGFGAISISAGDQNGSTLKETILQAFAVAGK